jgi:hypothetical protein
MWCENIENNMTDISRSASVAANADKKQTSDRIKRRYAAERRFKAYGVIAIVLAMSALIWLLASITLTGYQAFVQTYIKLDIHFDARAIDPQGAREPETLARANYAALYKQAIRSQFPEVKKRLDKRDLTRLPPECLACRIRRGRPVHQRRLRPGVSGSGPTVQGQGDRLVRQAGRGRCTGTKIQLPVLYVRHIARTRTGGHMGGHRRIILDDVGDAVA